MDLCRLESCSGAEPDLQAPEKEGSVCVSLQLEEHWGSQGLPGPGQGCGWLGIETKNRAKSQTQNYLVSFKLSVALKIPPKAFSLFPTFSLTPLPGCVNPAQPNGIFGLMVWTGKSYNRLDALEMMLHIPSLWAKLWANSWFNKNCKIIYIP